MPALKVTFDPLQDPELAHTRTALHIRFAHCFRACFGCCYAFCRLFMSSKNAPAALVLFRILFGFLKKPRLAKALCDFAAAS